MPEYLDSNWWEWLKKLLGGKNVRCRCGYRGGANVKYIKEFPYNKNKM